MIKKFLLFSAIALMALNLTACTTAGLPAPTNQPSAPLNENINAPANENVNAPATSPSAAIANPASVNCEKVGGKLVLETKKYNGQDLGQIGVCYFEDNRQCEEWALWRGECPVGGRKVTGYITEAGRFCAITGGEYNVTKEYPQVPDEEGTCTKAGKVCGAWQYYQGKCPVTE